MFYVRRTQAAPGFETSIGVRIKVVRRLREPHTSKCLDEYPPLFLPFTVNLLV
jgi:hypothetical protein